MMRWYVDVAPLDAEALEERACVEAPHWQQALQTVRAERGEQGPLSRFSIEVTDAGHRAIDPTARLRYLITKAVDEPAAVPLPIAAAPVFDGARLLYERAEDPTEAAPITYREYAYAVGPRMHTSELRALLDGLFAQVQQALASRPQGKFVQLALFDHVFDAAPERLPLATLAWKDWRGAPSIQIHTPTPSEAPAAPAAPPAAPPSTPAPAEAIEPPRSSHRPRAPDFDVIPRAPRAPSGGAVPSPSPAVASLPADPPAAGAATDPTPDAEDAPASVPSIAPPSHRERVRRGPESDLVGDVFERLAELEFCPDLVSGTDLALVTLWEVVPCAGTLIHVYDIDHGGFVVVRAAGPDRRGVLLHRTPEDDPVLAAALRSGRAVRADGPGDRPARERWAKLGVNPEHTLSAGIQKDARLLGAIELANPITPEPFTPAEENALLYLCEHLADFIAQRPLVLDDDVVIPEG
jgi:GAF domain-containing protein